MEIATIPRSPGARALSRSLPAAASSLSTSTPSPLTYTRAWLQWSRLLSYLTDYRPSPGRNLPQPSDPAREAYGPSDVERVGARTSASRRCPQAGRPDGGSGDRLQPLVVSARRRWTEMPSYLPLLSFSRSGLFWLVLFIYLFELGKKGGEIRKNAMCTMRVAC